MSATLLRPLSAAIVLALSATALHAQTPSPADEQKDQASALDDVIVTGTRRSDRTVGESLSPIDFLPARELQNGGSPDLNTILARTLPSFNFPRPAITDGTDHVRPAQLRGLAPDQTLVLVNGKRRHPTAIINVNGTTGRGSSPVDLSAIPVSAISRVEVLRDGAAAQYGSDAIAGVINVVLKDKAEGGLLGGRYGVYKKGDGELQEFAANGGFAVGASGFLNLTAEYRDKGFTNRARPDPRQQYPLVAGQPDPREARVNRNNHRFGEAAVEDNLLMANFGMPITESIEVYSFANYASREGNSAGFFRRALDARNIPAIYPDGFLPLILSESEDSAFNGGVRGTTAGGWAWDASYTYGENNFNFIIANSLNVNLGPTSPTRFDAGSLENTQQTFNFDVRNDLSLGALANPLSTAFGAEYRKESYEISPGQAESFFGTGSQVFPGFRPSDSGKNTRNSKALYADLETNFTDQFSASAAVRYEDFSDFGDTTSGKLAARFAPSELIAIRGTVSTGFRAPNLQQQFYSTTATNFINNVPFDIRTFAVNNPIAIALGAEPLKAEKSRNLSLGFVLTPTESFNVTVDAYRITIKDRIVLSENITEATAPGVRAFLASRGFPGTDGGRYFTNAIDTRTRGIDVIGRYFHDFGDWGSSTYTFGYNRNDTDITRIRPEPVTFGNQPLRIGRVETGRITVGAPKDKVNLGLEHNWNAWSGTLNATRYGSYTLLNASPTLDQTFGAEWVVDLSASYDFGGGVRATIGSENFNDRYPDQLIPANSFSGITPYPRGEAPFGFSGAFYYAKLSYTF
jgi:iron complex outermembrane recepter protein